MVLGKFAKYNFKSLPPYQTYDTLSQARKLGKFEGYSLDFLCKKFELGEKIITDFTLWERCEKGEEKALSEMFNYCLHDVDITKRLYLFLRGKTKGHTNLALYVEDSNACPVCLGTNFEFVRDYKTSVNKYASQRCLECGIIKRTRKRVKLEIDQEFVPIAR